ncbi:MAG: hypothetical protein CVV17_03920 [Gammaproteobacteria bacterium HGW-Gammaproteobacteria-7]|jgi:outer membrane lipoprotein SlyB|nr:MAG: hypothetical protein CVV17_03920 [Gammaproteobacteria bacterium HGW-Gammaproteobacteria-7]
MSKYALPLAAAAALALAGCGQHDAIRLDDGRTIEIPQNVEIDQWAKATLTAADGKAVEYACQREDGNASPRVQTLCQIAFMNVDPWKPD